MDYPIEGLDMSKYCLGGNTGQNHTDAEPPPPLLYDLVAVSQHHGGLGGGHYTAVARSSVDGKWYNFDDSHVSEVPLFICDLHPQMGKFILHRPERATLSLVRGMFCSIYGAICLTITYTTIGAVRVYQVLPWTSTVQSSEMVLRTLRTRCRCNRLESRA